MIGSVTRRPVFVIGFFFLLYLAAALFSSPFPKGSDQYWNTSNIDRVIHGDGQYRTNNIFPASMPDSVSDLPRPWVQNRPVVYLAVTFAYLFRNANASFVILNCVFLFFAAFLLYRLLVYANKVDEDRALLLTALFLIFPINFYLATQALPEIFNEFVAIAIGYTLLCAQPGLFRSVLVAFLCGVLMYQRDTNILLVPLIALYYFLYARESALSGIISMAVVIVLFILLRPYLLPSHTIQPLDGWAVITNVRPGTSDMINYLYKDLPPIGLSQGLKIIAQKFGSAMKFQFVPEAATGVFFYLINALLVALVAIGIRIRKLAFSSQKLLTLAIIFVLLHFATVILFRNQYRFAAIILPYLFIGLLLALDYFKWFRNWQQRLLLAVAVLFVAINAASGIQNRRAALKEHQEVVILQDAKKKYIGEKPLLVHRFDAANSLIAAYAFSPNPCFYFPGDQDVQQLFTVGRTLDTDLLVLKKDTKAYERFLPYIVSEQVIDKPRNLVLVKYRTN